MGQTLTGTTPQDTYESLIKVADNGPLSATAKFLSDGEGLDSALALSTTAVGIGTAAPSQPLVVFKADAANDIGQIIQQGSNGTAAFLNIVGANDAGASFNRITSSTSGGTAHWQLGGGGTASTMVLLTGGTERMRITSAGNVGIGTSAPATKLSIVDNSPLVVGNSSGSISVTEETGTTLIGQGGGIFLGIPASAGSFFSTFIEASRETNDGANSAAALLFGTRIGGGANTEQMRITSAGVLNLTQGQIKFPATQVPSADANTLDDYEEGTWTIGIQFGGASVGVTSSGNTGTYTKIGRQVTVNGILSLTSKGSSTGIVEITGLPFTIAVGVSNFCVASLWLNNVSFANQFVGRAIPNTNAFRIEEFTEAGALSNITNADFANNSEVVLSLTYFV